VTIFSQALFALVGSHLVAFAFFATRQCLSPPLVYFFNAECKTAVRSKRAIRSKRASNSAYQWLPQEQLPQPQAWPLDLGGE